MMASDFRRELAQNLRDEAAEAQPIDTGRGTDELRMQMRYLRARRRRLQAEVDRLRASIARARAEMHEADVALAAAADELRARRAGRRDDA
jgi:hypothetical protein